MSYLRWIPVAALGVAVSLGSSVDVRAADEDAISITGCVVNAPPTTPVAGDRSFLVWSEGDVIMTDVTARLVTDAPVGTAGVAGMPVLLWVDDEDDLERHAGQFIEIRGEVDRELNPGEVEFERDDEITEIKFEWEGEDVEARVPTFLLGGLDVDDAEFNVLVRRVDVDEIRVISPTCR